ncbi:uncharacterized protein LOC131294099 [Anopheles ziemanni]|uniref:uncharacterized protein LOC131264833 n=1 Tax=Anopheles coustani TaxID=139045 RepID=UPI002657C5BB|nr:uncharacterized protein LOC131264833 [Anopheles coustani]XP_058178129.1 uncharacterized protein LOC131294099 [Anopheles ziemanni]
MYVKLWDLCRLCAKYKEDRVAIFSKEGRALEIQGKIHEAFGLHIAQTDRFPQCVCKECLQKVDKHVKIRKHFLKIHRKLVKWSKTKDNKMFIRISRVKEPEMVNGPGSSVNLQEQSSPAARLENYISSIPITIIQKTNGNVTVQSTNEDLLSSMAHDVGIQTDGGTKSPVDEQPEQTPKQQPIIISQPQLVHANLLSNEQSKEQQPQQSQLTPCLGMQPPINTKNVTDSLENGSLFLPKTPEGETHSTFNKVDEFIKVIPAKKQRIVEMLDSSENQSSSESESGADTTIEEDSPAVFRFSPMYVYDDDSYDDEDDATSRGVYTSTPMIVEQTPKENQPRDGPAIGEAAYGSHGNNNGVVIRKVDIAPPPRFFNTLQPSVPSLMSDITEAPKDRLQQQQEQPAVVQSIPIAMTNVSTGTTPIHFPTYIYQHQSVDFINQQQNVSVPAQQQHQQVPIIIVEKEPDQPPDEQIFTLATDKGYLRLTIPTSAQSLPDLNANIQTLTSSIEANTANVGGGQTTINVQDDEDMNIDLKLQNLMAAGLSVKVVELTVDPYAHTAERSNNTLQMNQERSGVPVRIMEHDLQMMDQPPGGLHSEVEHDLDSITCIEPFYVIL